MVTRTDDRVISTSYISTTGGWAAVQAVTRGTTAVPVDIAETAETLTISTGREVPIFMDWGDLYQSPWTQRPEIMKRSAQRLNEFTETDVLDDHASWRNLGGSGGVWTDNVATTLAISAGNVDDLVRLVRQVIRTQNGKDLAEEYGIFHVWDPASFNFLEAFAQAFLELLGLIKSFLIYGENPEEDNAYQPEREVQRLSERNCIMQYATV